MLLRKYQFILLLMLSTLSWASLEKASIHSRSLQTPLASREQEIWSAKTHGTEFATVAHLTAAPNCSATQPPEALATPDPMLANPDTNTKITVSFIIGTDGRVHSPLILESAGDKKDKTVLDTVRFWRYRPAMCNGVPTETEGKIEFSN